MQERPCLGVRSGSGESLARDMRVGGWNQPGSVLSPANAEGRPGEWRGRALAPRLAALYFVALGLCLPCSMVRAGDPGWIPPLQKECGPELVEAYNALTKPQPLKGSPTEGLAIRRPGFQAVLGPGSLFAETAPGGHVRYYYEGSAKISFQVSDPVERAHLKLFIGREELQEVEVKNLLIFPLGPCPDLPGSPAGDLAPQAPGDYQRFKNALRVQGLDALTSVLNRGLCAKDDLLVLFRMDGNTWSYRKDAMDEEEVSLCRLGNPPHMELWWWDKAVSLHLTPAGGLTRIQTRPEYEAKILADVLHIEADLKLDSSGDALPGSLARVRLRLLKPARALKLYCGTRVGVSRVSLAGAAIPFIKEEYAYTAFYTEPALILLLPEGAAGELDLEIAYSGDLFENDYGCQSMWDEDGWFPSLDDADGWTLTFKADVPKGYEAVGLGDLASHETSEGDGRETYRYEMKQPIRLATFLFGKFKHTKATAEGIEVDLAFPDNRDTIYISRNRKTIEKEVTDALKTYTRLFGPLPYKVLRVGLTGSHANRGFPTLVLCSWTVLGRGGTSSWPEQVMVHEVAHQWWYNQAPPMTYRDAWVSESLAEYSSYICLLENMGFDTMAKYLSHDYNTFTKVSAVRQKPYVEFGPISLGARLFTTLEPDDSYQTIVYYKGAWTLLGLNRMAFFTPAGEKSFYDGLKDFLAKAQGRLVTTADLREALERSMKVKLDWYFDQWLDSSVIPKVKVKTSVVTEGGSTKLVVEGTQDSTLTLPIPILAMQGKTYREFLFFLKPGGSKSEFPVPFKPDKIRVDPKHYCLAEYE